MSDLRRELKKTRTQVHDLEVKVKMESKAMAREGKTGKRRASLLGGSSGRLPASPEPSSDETQRTINQQKVELRRLRLELRDLQSGVPSSPSGRLPPLDVVPRTAPPVNVEH